MLSSLAAFLLPLASALSCPYSFYESGGVCTRFYSSSAHPGEPYYPSDYAGWENKPGCAPGQLVCPYYGNDGSYAACGTVYEDCPLPPFLDATQPVDVRVNDVLAAMSDTEKINQLYSGWDDDNTQWNPVPNNEVPRLGIPRYWWLNEGLHGLARMNGTNNTQGSTSFPQVIGLGSTWNTSLWNAIGEVESYEYRSVHNDAMWTSIPRAYRNLNVYAPNINIYRDPRWGRGQETPGEDPFLTGSYAVHFVSGLQDTSDGVHPKIGATCKHLAVYNLEYYNGVDRTAYNAVVDDFDLRETYLRAFEACVTEAKVRSIMCSYNAVNGVPTCTDPWLLTDLLRNEWGFEGFVVSDYGAINAIQDNHHYTPPTGTYVSYALQSGCDQDGGDSAYIDQLGTCLANGQITQDDLNRAVGRLYRQLIELGLFDAPDAISYNTIPPSVTRSPQHIALSREAARQSIVLLKNLNGALPLSRSSFLSRKIAVVGPNANTDTGLMGNYQAIVPEDAIVTVLEGITESLQGAGVPASNVLYAAGCGGIDCEGSGEPNLQAVDNVINAADAVILVIGLRAGDGWSNKCNYCEGEELDRVNIDLPPNQVTLINNVIQTKGDKPLIVVLVNGGSLSIGFLQNNAQVNAIVELWYPNEQGGLALADVLFGDYNPAGRLTTTWVQKTSDLPDYGNVTMFNRTYRYFTGTPLYPFGYGLSYTTFAYSNLVIPQSTISPCDVLKLSVDVANTGSLDGGEVIQVYASFTGTRSPKYTLVAFDRVAIKAGTKVTQQLTIYPKQMSVAEEDDQHHGKWVIEPGTYSLYVGGGQPSFTTVVSGKFTITGTSTPITSC